MAKQYDFRNGSPVEPIRKDSDEDEIPAGLLQVMSATDTDIEKIRQILEEVRAEEDEE